MTNEKKLKQAELDLENRKYSYDLTQKLTFFVISAELVFCGYLLINADKIAGVRHSSSLFLVSAVAALLGVTWRFFYNQSYHNNAHKIKNKLHVKYLQNTTYFGYVLLSFSLFISITYLGFSYIKEKESTSLSESSIKIEDSLNKSLQPTAKALTE
jgi:hypothetical protein